MAAAAAAICRRAIIDNGTYQASQGWTYMDVQNILDSIEAYLQSL